MAQQGWSLTGIGGWVDRWVRRCGCGCLVGPQWGVTERLAYELAETFYRLLEQGKTIGEAAWVARQQLREIAPDDPSWLTYAVFAHPACRVAFDPGKDYSLTESELEARSINPANYRSKAVADLHRVPLPSPPDPYVAHRYTLLQTKNLVGRKAELQQLNDWVADPNSLSFRARLFNLVAIGGMGKSALAWKWFGEQAPHEMCPLAGRVWWSFYEHGATFERFIVQTLAYVLGCSVETVKEMPPADREDRLLSILDEHPFLIVLDGLERIMIAYAKMDAARIMDDDLDEKTANIAAETLDLPASAEDSFVRRHRLRKAQEPQAGAFLLKLTRIRASRFLITTRLYPAELQDPFTGEPVPGSMPYFLDGLRGADSLELWRALGVSGEGSQILPILDLAEHHPLVIRALAGEVASYRPAPGNFDRWLADHPGFDPATLELVQVRSHILRFALRGLSKPARRVSQAIAALRMPAYYGTLKGLLLNASAPLADPGQLDAALADLEDRGLVGWDREANLYDMHPLIRGVIWGSLAAQGQRDTYEDIRAHFESIPAIYQYQVTDPEALSPAIELCFSLNKLGRYEEACRLYYLRISDTIMDHLNSHLAIDLLESFFPSGIGQPPPLAKSYEQFEIGYRLAAAYRANGQVARAAEMLRRLVLDVDGVYNLSPGELDMAVDNLSASLLACGSLYEAEMFARRTNSPYYLGNVLLARGAVRRAQEKYNPSIDFGLAQCALLAGNPEIALALSERALEVVKAMPSYGRSDAREIDYLHLQACSRMELGGIGRARKMLQEILPKARAVNDV